MTHKKKESNLSYVEKKHTILYTLYAVVGVDVPTSPQTSVANSATFLPVASLGNLGLLNDGQQEPPLLCGCVPQDRSLLGCGVNWGGGVVLPPSSHPSASCRPWSSLSLSLCLYLSLSPLMYGMCPLSCPLAAGLSWDAAVWRAGSAASSLLGELREVMLLLAGKPVALIGGVL